jgi:hypothetical protein
MSDQDPNLPPDLADALRGAFTHRPQGPPMVDSAILFAARRKFDARRRLRMRIFWGTGVAAAVAACIMVVVMLIPDKRPDGAPQAVGPETRPALKGDFNGDGKVDIVDAMLLAKHLADREPQQVTWDFNGDGKIDDADVQAVAAAAVKVPPTSVVKQTVPVATLPPFDERRMLLPPMRKHVAGDLALKPTCPEDLQ